MIETLVKIVFATKIDKNTLLRAHFSALNRFWVDFWALAGSQNDPKSSNFAEDGQHFWRYFFEVVLRGCLQTFWDRSGRLRGRSGDPPGGFPEAFWRIFLEKMCCKNNGKNRVENLERHPGRTHNRKKSSAKPLQNSRTNSSKHSGQSHPQ